MSFFKNILNGSSKRNAIDPDDKAKDSIDDVHPSDIFEGGHQLTALENIGSSLTTLWSSCGLNIMSSRENISTQTALKSIPSTSKDIASATSEESSMGASY